VEPFAWSPIRDVRTALELLDATDAPNAGLLVDVWHFFNGGAPLDQLRQVAAVQLNNGPRVSDDFLRLASATRWQPEPDQRRTAPILELWLAQKRTKFAKR
jgi:hypothetical protein